MNLFILTKCGCPIWRQYYITAIVTTGDRFTEDMTDGGVIVAKKGDLKLWQKVISVGSSVRDVAPGDMVMINADHYAVKKYNKNSVQNDLDNNPVLSYKFNWVTIDDKNGNPQDCLLLDNRDILYAFEGKEEKDIVIPRKTIIM
jgi:hypothetical protein